MFRPVYISPPPSRRVYTRVIKYIPGAFSVSQRGSTTPTDTAGKVGVLATQGKEELHILRLSQCIVLSALWRVVPESWQQSIDWHSYGGGLHAHVPFGFFLIDYYYIWVGAVFFMRRFCGRATKTLPHHHGCSMGRIGCMHGCALYSILITKCVSEGGRDPEEGNSTWLVCLY